MKKYDREFYVVAKYVSVSNYHGAQGPKLATKGCSCCSQEYDLSPEILAIAIQDAEAFVKQLKQLQKVIDWQDVANQRVEWDS